jgi:hypothetical protein
MDEKTAELRDIFRDVTDTETVTESQSDDRGSLADRESLREGIRAVLDQLAENEGLPVELSRSALVDVVVGYYDGADDEAIARDLDSDATADLDADAIADAVRRGRLACHLIREGDLEAPFDVDRLRTLRQDGLAPSACADRLDADPDAVERVAAAFDAREAMIRTGGRYPDAFESALAEAGLAERFTANTKRDGLEEATADAEVDTDF